MACKGIFVIRVQNGWLMHVNGEPFVYKDLDSLFQAFAAINWDTGETDDADC